MNVVDSSAWLATFAGDANAVFFAPVIKETETLVVPALCFYEVFKRLLAQRGEESALTAAGMMSTGIIADLTREIAIHAAVLALEHKMAMADSIILATTQTYKATLWTQDAVFAGLESVKYLEKK